MFSPKTLLCFQTLPQFRGAFQTLAEPSSEMETSALTMVENQHLQKQRDQFKNYEEDTVVEENAFFFKQLLFFSCCPACAPSVQPVNLLCQIWTMMSVRCSYIACWLPDNTLSGKGESLLAKFNKSESELEASSMPNLMDISFFR